MRDWQAFVRSQFKLPNLAPEREARIVRELAAQLEDFYREAIAGGSGEAEADAHACRQIRDWDRMAQDVWMADRRNARPSYERIIEPRLERLSQPQARPTATGGGLLMFANIVRDTRYAIRQLLRAPGFTVVAILTLALGIGATSAIFSVVNGVLLRPLAYPNPDRIVRLNELVPRYGRFSVAPATFLDWRQQNTVFSQIVAMNSTGATLVSSTGAERIAGGLVSWDTFDLLQVSPALGRSFRAEEDAPGKDDVIILSHGMWQRRFGGDPAILGKSVTLSGTPVTVIGVMPAGFSFVADAEFWRPLALPANPSRGGHYLGVIARLKPGVTAEQAGAEIKTISERLAVQYPDTSANESAEVLGLQDSIVAGIRPALLTLLAAVGVVILIACANVANLLLVRASVRGKEIAIRTALGAGRGRLVLQMLSESLVLALAGGAVGLLLAYLAIDPIQKLSAGSIPRVAEIRIDGSVLLFALLVSLATGILFGLAPAWQASRSTIGSVLKEGGRSSTSSSGRWMRNALLVAEVAMSIVLLVGAALLLRSFARLTSVDPGFKPEHVLAFRVALPTAAYTDDQQRAAFFRGSSRGSTRSPRSPRRERRRRCRCGATTSCLSRFRGSPRQSRTKARPPTSASPARTTSRRSASRCCGDAPSPIATRPSPPWWPSSIRSSSIVIFQTAIRSARASTSATAATASTRLSAWLAASAWPTWKRIPRRRCTCRSTRIRSAAPGSSPGPTAIRRRSPRLSARPSSASIQRFRRLP